MAITSEEITGWFVFLGATGAAVFSWGMTRYTQFRSARRAEDEADRKAMLDSLREHAKIISDLEARENRLKQEFEEYRKAKKDNG
jgi:hypothetical protein